MLINHYPQDINIVNNFQFKMQNVLDVFLVQCEQLQGQITNDLLEAEKKDSLLAQKLLTISSQQLNAYERGKLKELQEKIEKKKSKIAKLKSFVYKIQEFQEDQVQCLKKYFIQAIGSFQLEKIEEQSQFLSNQPNNSPGLVQQLYLQIQDLQIKIKNLNLEVQMKEVYQHQVQELTEKYSKLALAHQQMHAEQEQMIEVQLKLEGSNKNLQNERDQLVKRLENLELNQIHLKSELDQTNSIILDRTQQKLTHQLILDTDISQLGKQQAKVANNMTLPAFHNILGSIQQPSHGPMSNDDTDKNMKPDGSQIFNKMYSFQGFGQTGNNQSSARNIKGTQMRTIASWNTERLQNRK